MKESNMRRSGLRDVNGIVLLDKPVGISSNDVANYPQDSPEKMK